MRCRELYIFKIRNFGEIVGQFFEFFGFFFDFFGGIFLEELFGRIFWEDFWEDFVPKERKEGRRKI